MDRITIEYSESEIDQIHEAASKRGLSDEEFVKQTSLVHLPLHLLSDDELGAHIREKNRELYKRLS